MSLTQVVLHGSILEDCYNPEKLPPFHLQITDAPYSDHVHDKAVSVDTRDTPNAKGIRARDLGFDSLSDELRDRIASYAHFCRGWSLLYSDIEGHHAWRQSLEAAKAQYIRTLPWVRWSMPQTTDDRPPSCLELVICAHSYKPNKLLTDGTWSKTKPKAAKKVWFGPRNLMALTHKCMRGEDKHPTQKPLDQLLDLVEWFSEPGETVFDATLGHGTTAVACTLLGRNFFGVEKKAEHVEVARARLEAAQAAVREGNPDLLVPRDRDHLVRYLERKANYEPKPSDVVPWEEYVISCQDAAVALLSGDPGPALAYLEHCQETT